MSDDWDLEPEEICREEDCTVRGVHRKHLIRRRARVRAHHRPDPDTPQLPFPPEPKLDDRQASRKRPPWKRDDPKALTHAVARATSRAFPTHISAIVRDVRDDYGDVTERTVYRHVARLVARGHLIKLDVGLTFCAYLRPKSRLLNDLDAVREYLLATVELNHCTSNRRVRRRAPRVE